MHSLHHDPENPATHQHSEPTTSQQFSPFRPHECLLLHGHTRGMISLLVSTPCTPPGILRVPATPPGILRVPASAPCIHTLPASAPGIHTVPATPPCIHTVPASRYPLYSRYTVSHERYTIPLSTLSLYPVIHSTTLSRYPLYHTWPVSASRHPRYVHVTPGIYGVASTACGHRELSWVCPHVPPGIPVSRS